jgi:ribosomal protein S18 acetylase RimI-like enzyme
MIEGTRTVSSDRSTGLTYTLRMDGRLTQRAVEVNWRNLALGHDVFEADGATFVRDSAWPEIYDANFVFGVTVSQPNDIERLLARVGREYEHAARLTFRVDPFTPPAFEARLALDGYERSEALVLLLEGPLHGDARRFEIRRVEDEATWQAYAELKYLDWREHTPSMSEEIHVAAIAQGLASSSRLKCPPVNYVLAYEDGRAVGYCSSWQGFDGVGQVEDLFVQPSCRHRGIATALIHECVGAARASGAGPVVIVADVTNTSKVMYAALGWRPVAICRQYGKKTAG